MTEKEKLALCVYKITLEQAERIFALESRQNVTHNDHNVAVIFQKGKGAPLLSKQITPRHWSHVHGYYTTAKVINNIPLKDNK